MLPTPKDLEIRERRQSWWLLVSRLASGTTQQAAAEAIGLQNASSYGDYERGVTPPSLRQLAILATLYSVPLSVFTEPRQTDEERLEELTGRPSRRTVASDEPRRRRRRSA